MMRALILSLLVLLSLQACSKEQKTTNRLDGVWQLASRKVNGVPDTTISNMLISFQKCNTNKYDDCQGTLQQTIAATGEVQTSDFGFSTYWENSLDIDFDSNNPFFHDMNCDLLQVSRYNLTFEYTDARQSFDRIKLSFRQQH